MLPNISPTWSNIGATYVFLTAGASRLICSPSILLNQSRLFVQHNQNSEPVKAKVFKIVPEWNGIKKKWSGENRTHDHQLTWLYETVLGVLATLAPVLKQEQNQTTASFCA